MLKKSNDHKNIPIKKSSRVEFLFLYKKICTQGFNDILSGFRVTFFNRTPKIKISQTSMSLGPFVDISGVIDWNDSFKLNLITLKQNMIQNLIKRYI